MDKLRVAVIGAGIAQRHLVGFNDNPNLFDVRVLCSLDEERGRKAAEEAGVAEFTTDTGSLFDRDDIDVIDICTPPHNHFELVERTIKAGKHAICEKPLFGSISDVDRMMGIVKGTGLKVMPIFQYRYGAGLQKLKRLIEADLTGPAFMTTVETHWWRPPAYYEIEWRGKWKTELGGGLLGHAIHAHDMLNYVHGPCAEVFAFGDTLLNDIEVEDSMALAARMANGSLATLSMTLGSREEISRLRFCFKNLVAESITAPYTMGNDPWKFVAGDPEHQAKVDAALADAPAHMDHYSRQFELFAEAVARDTEPPVTLQDARNALELVTAAYHSDRTGRPVAMPLQADHPLYGSWLPAEGEARKVPA
jgi:predicted dehydrogenase